MSKIRRVEAINVAGAAREKLIERLMEEGRVEEAQEVPHQDRIAEWLQDNEKYQKNNNGEWAVSNTDLHEAIRAVREDPLSFT